ncbi:MAG: glycosyltransferase family 4 protein [bacterium]|nr:glycosyltransferase family 4 protein [bacterium]
MTHICFFARSLLAHGLGGNERQVKSLIDSAVSLGHSVTVITTHHPRGIDHEEVGLTKIHYLPEAPSRRLSPTYWEASARTFERIHTRHPVDLVMDISLAGYGWVTNCRQRWPLPFVPFMTGGWKDTLRNRWAENDGLADLAHFFLRALPEWWWGYRRWYRGIIEAADRILTDNTYVIPVLGREFGVPETKFRATFAPVDVERFRADPALRDHVRKQYGFGEGQPVILMVATLSKQKGVQIGLEAVGRLRETFPNLGVLVVGGGPYEEILRELADRLGLAERVVFCGPVEPETMPAYYNAADLFVNPTLRVEGMPCVITEAMASGTPVITSAMGGIPDVVVHGQTGRLVPRGDVDRLSEEIARLLTHPEERRALAETALRHVHDHLTEEHFTQVVDETIQEVLDSKT